MSNSEKLNLPQFGNRADSVDGVFEIPYKPEMQRFGESLVKITSPILLFSIYMIWCIFNVNDFVLVNMLGLAAISFTTLHLFLVFCLLRNNFILTRTGITLPRYYIMARFPRLTYKWEHLTGLSFNRSDAKQFTADQFMLHFEDPEAFLKVDMAFAFRDFDQLDMKKLIYAVVTNAPHAVVTPNLESVAIDFPTVSGIKQLNFSNFTSLWEEEFSARYSPTLFVPLEPEQQLQDGRITIVELIACGGSAAIYSATNKQDEKVIVKESVVPKNATDALKAKATEMFSREALLLSKLDHPHIAKVFDHFVENNHHYEVLEFIDGLDLRRFVRERGPQPADFVLNWAEQICEILLYLHTQDPPIIHRDLTPDNIVLRVDGQLILIDFGAANAFIGTATGTMVGKQSYMPLEQLRGKSVPQSDIFALGGTIYFLLTGQDPKPLEQSQLDANFELPVNFNPLLAKCTAVEVSERYQSAQEVLDAIRLMRQERIILLSASRD